MGLHSTRETVMPRRKPCPNQQNASHLRQSIAGVAARLMAEDGISDYGQAKRKAARTFGAIDSDALPSNQEVAAELRSYQALFQEDEHADRIRRLRGVALAVMALLESFRPCLIGAVLDGTAGRYADVELELFADSAKDVEIFLLSRHIPYEHLKPGRTRPDAPEAKLRMECQDEYVILLIQPHQAERRNSGQGRARAPEVAAPLAD